MSTELQRSRAARTIASHSAFLGDLLGRLFGALQRRVHAEDPRALAGEEDGRRLAVAEPRASRARAGDDGNFTFQSSVQRGVVAHDLKAPSMRTSIRYGPPEASPRWIAGPTSADFSMSSPATPIDLARPT